MLLYVLGLTALALLFIVQMISSDQIILRAVQNDQADESSLSKVFFTKSLEENIRYGQVAGIALIGTVILMPVIFVIKKIQERVHRGEKRVFEQ